MRVDVKGSINFETRHLDFMLIFNVTDCSRDQGRPAHSGGSLFLKRDLSTSQRYKGNRQTPSKLWLINYFHRYFKIILSYRDILSVHDSYRPQGPCTHFISFHIAMFPLSVRILWYGFRLRLSQKRGPWSMSLAHLWVAINLNSNETTVTPPLGRVRKSSQLGRFTRQISSIPQTTIRRGTLIQKAI